MSKWSLDDAERAFKEHVAATAGRNGTPAPQPRTAPAPDPVGADFDDLAPYIKAGIRRQLDLLRNAAPGTAHTRNTTLFISAKALGRIEDVDRAWLTEQLIDACEINGYVDDDGITATRRSIRSGYTAADKEGPRIIPDNQYFDRYASVFEVGSEFFATSAPRPNGVGAAPAPAVRPSTIFDLEADFWERDCLRTIYDAALARMTPPWGVLAHCVARALYRIPPAVMLPATIGGKTSLNWFGAVTSISGDGKTSSGEVGALLVKGVPDTNIRNMGSGEGLVAQYRPPGRNPNDQSALMFVCDEIDTMDAMRSRQGSTTSSVLCNAFMGNPPGHSYVKNAPTRQLEKHAYRMTLIVGVQPGRAGALLEDRYSGMLQRFQWFPGFDPRGTRARARPGEFINSLELPDNNAWQYPHHDGLTVPAQAVEEMLTAAEQRNMGLIDALDGHLLLVRLKFAFALAVLDNRTELDLEDWRLAGIAGQVSRATRCWVEQEYHKVADELALARGRPLGLVRLGADEARADITDQRILDCARWAYRRLKKVGAQTNRELQQSCDHKRYRWFNAATRWLQDNGWIESIKCTDGKKRWTLSKQ